MFQIYNSTLFLFTKYITEQIQFYPVESRRQVSYYSEINNKMYKYIT